MGNEKIFAMAFSKVYPMLIAKAERKGRSREDVYEVTSWLTGYTVSELEELLASSISYGEFFEKAPCLNEKRRLFNRFRKKLTHRRHPPLQGGNTYTCPYLRKGTIR